MRVRKTPPGRVDRNVPKYVRRGAGKRQFGSISLVISLHARTFIGSSE